MIPDAVIITGLAGAITGCILLEERRARRGLDDEQRDERAAAEAVERTLVADLLVGAIDPEDVAFLDFEVPRYVQLRAVIGSMRELGVAPTTRRIVGVFELLGLPVAGLAADLDAMRAEASG